ncbi:MAG: antibiotic biosynthesis monooxygenase [Pyrinomonadaceae bacterium]|nr:antibiotic biosynthesis monooxygenase [Pyrinomonadaceae bacterium]
MVIAKTPTVPYYAVIFTSIRTDDNNDYAEIAQRMVELASEQIGFLGIESARDGLGITVSYWQDLQSIKHWRENAEHKLAQQKGYQTFYQSFATRICKVERDYFFEK